MSTTLIDNFSYKGKGFLDSRQSVPTLAALKAMPETQSPDGFQCHCAEDGQWYQYGADNTVDPSTGKWRPSGRCLQTTGDCEHLPMSQKAVTQAITERQFVYDVSRLHPTSGIDGTDIYDIATAIKVVPSNARRFVRLLSFKGQEADRELWIYDSESNTSVSYWEHVNKFRRIDPSANILECGEVVNANSARVMIPIARRIPGTMIHFSIEGIDSYEIYVGKKYEGSEKYFSCFVRFYTKEQVDSLISRDVHSLYSDDDQRHYISELYVDKAEPDETYQFTRIIKNDAYPDGLIWINRVGDSSPYSVFLNNGIGTDDAVLELASSDGSFHAYAIINWQAAGENTPLALRISDAAKIIENSPVIYARMKMQPIAAQAAVGAALESRLYQADDDIAYEDSDEQEGNEDYSYSNVGIVHKAVARERFNYVELRMSRPINWTESTGSLIVKKGKAVTSGGGVEIRRIDDFGVAGFPENGVFGIALGQNVTLEQDEYLWVYYTGKVRIRVWNADNDNGNRTGMYFSGSINTYKYSTAMTLKSLKGDLVSLNERVEKIEECIGTVGNGRVAAPMVTMPPHLYAVTGREQTFYYNEIVFGIESNHDNTLLNYNIEASMSPSGAGKKCLTTKEGFTVYTSTPGDYTVILNIYDQFFNLIAETRSMLHVVEAPVVSGKSILMLGDSWTDINMGNRGYTPYLDTALKEMGISMRFIGTRNAGTSGLKHEGIGGYDWNIFASAPATVRFKFFVADMPSISDSDIYSNNGSTYRLRERGSGYITMSRESGNTEPSGNILTRTSGTGDDTITFSEWLPGGSNPLWNSVTGKLDFRHYRKDICGMEESLDICSIQLGVNDCLSPDLKTSRKQWSGTLASVTAVLDAILADSPGCKIIVNLVGMDAPSPTGWTSLSGFVAAKRKYQTNCYWLRTYVNELIMARDDFNTRVFIGQSVLGINRWYGYGYTDRRYRYFRIADTISSEDLEKLRLFDFQQRSVYVYTEDGKEFIAYGYDARGYLVCLAEQSFASWEKHDQEFAGNNSVANDDVPGSGTLVKGGGSSSVDFPDVPYTECRIENNNSKEHWFMNATHPYDLGYRQMAYCLANQIAGLLGC